MKTIIQGFLLFVSLSGLTIAQPVATPKMQIPAKGVIQGINGAKFSYSRSVARETYFAMLDSEVYRIVFPPEAPLPNDPESKTMLANFIVSFYTGPLVREDGKFDSKFENWKAATKFQAKGFYIQCTTYPSHRIWLDLKYSPDNTAISEVIVSQGMAR